MNIKQAYNVKPQKIIKADEGYILHLSKSKLILRHVNAKEWEVVSAAEIIDYVNSRGFTNIISIKRDREGKPYIKEDSRIFILTDDTEGLKLRLNKIDNGKIMARILAEFHYASEGYVQPSGMKINVRWGRRMEKYRTLGTKLEKYRDCLNQKSCDEALNEFEQFTKIYIDKLTERAGSSLKVLRSFNYLKTLESSMKKRQLCINAISSNTAKVLNNRAVIEKVFEIGYNMAEEDIAELIKKIVEETGDRKALEDIIEEYEREKKLGPYSKEIIRALVAFPRNSIRTIVKYMDNPDKGEALLRKLKKYLEDELRTDVMGV